MRDIDARQRSRLALGVIALAAAVILGLTAVTELGESSESARRPWAIVSIALTAFLLVVFVLEIRRRLRSDQAAARVAEVLLPLSRSPGMDSDDRPVAQQFEELASCAALAVGAPSATLQLDHGGTSTRFDGVPDGPDAAGAPDGTDDTDDTDDIDDDSGRRTVALVSEGVTLGSLEVTAPAGGDFTGADLRVLELLAPRLAAHVDRVRLGDAERRSRLEAEQARRQVNVLAQASVPLAPGLENPEETIRELADIIVPAFADLFAVDLIRDGGQLERIVVAYTEPDLVTAFAEQSARHPAWQDTLLRVMTDVESELVFSMNDDEDPPADDHGALLHALGMQSWVVAPIRVRDASLGTMTLATSRSRRGYRPSDQVTIDELVARSALAFERGLLYREARHAAAEASRRANQLARMVEATTVLTRTLALDGLLDVLVEQAAFVLDAPHARVELFSEGGLVAEFGPTLSEPARLCSPIVGRLGDEIGRLTVERPADVAFAAGDNAVLTMLAESASVANRNAQLYEDARNREQRLQALIEASPLAILEIDDTGTVSVANPAARVLFPVADTDAMELVQTPAEFADRLPALIAGTRRGERTELELITIDDSGERRNLWISTAPVSVGIDSVCMLAVVTDMTGRKRLEEQLADAQRFEAIASLAGGVAHDFNNLLTVILGYSELLLLGLDQVAPERESVEAIQEAGNHAAVITNQLLTLSRHQALQPETIDAIERCEALLPMLRRIAGTAVTIEAHLVGSVFITVDPGQLEQVLFNLVFNSRDAMLDGGHIRIEAGERPGPAGDPQAFVSVSDDGEGMDAETLARCQEPFFTTKSRSRGIGLGLATVASILQRSGGTLQMTSEIGRGTSSTVLFPSVGAATVPLEPGVEPGVEHGVEPGRGHVLLVDDDEQVRRFTARVLTKAGYAVTEVGDGESAIRALEDGGRFDLLITDVQLPAMTGTTVARTVRDRWPEVACLLITGYADTQARDAEVGTTMAVPKPFTPEELTRAATAALQATRSASGVVD